METTVKSKEKKKGDKRRKRLEANKKKEMYRRQQEALRISAFNDVIPRLSKLFEGKSPNVIRMAEAGFSPLEIAEHEGISEEDAEAIVTEFTKLPHALATKILNNPRILSSESALEILKGVNRKELLRTKRKMVEQLQSDIRK